MSIFVRIASYRDPELVPTLTDCIAKARWPAALRFAICWQHDPAETLSGLEEDPRFRIIDVPHVESRGMGWARHLCAGCYEGEEFTISLDSHHRFAEHWDQLLIDMVELSGATKPVLTTYPPPYDPQNPAALGTSPCWIKFARFEAEGTTGRSTEYIDDFAALSRPVPARFYAGGFAFSVGKFVEEVEPDPHIYFRGEEDSLGVRAFTHGYDLFHPHRIVCWHYYERREQPKHWGDHVEGRTRLPDWHILDAEGVARFRTLVGQAGEAERVDLAKWGRGGARTIHDYEAYAGISYARRSADNAAVDGVPPKLQTRALL
jgi:hypothetical protein